MKTTIPANNLDALYALKRIACFLFCTLLLSSIYFSAKSQVELIKDIGNSEEPTYNEYISLISGDKIYFISNNELWRSNGTLSSNVKLKAFKSLSNLTAVGNTLYFVADDGVTGSELWKSNGSIAGTVSVKDILPGTAGSSPYNLTAGNGFLFFVANTKNGREIWKSDGSAAGTLLVKDIHKGTASSQPNHLTNVNGTIYFSASDGLSGHELWKTNGSESGTTMVKDIRTPLSRSSYPSHLVNLNGTLFFSANDNTTGIELWKSNGTRAGTVRVKDIRTGPRGSDIDNMIAVGNSLFFTADDAIHGDELWSSTGTTNGTKLVKDLNPGRAGSNNTNPDSPHGMGNFTDINGFLYFTGSKGYSDFIYRSDGTEPGTVIVQPIATANVNTSQAGIMYPNPAFTYLNGYVYYFNSIDGADVQQTEGGAWYHLWKTPYYATSPRQVKTFYRMYDYAASRSGYSQEMINFNNNIFTFGRLDATRGFEFIKSNGTSHGTFAVNDAVVATKSIIVSEMITVGNITYILEGKHFSKTLYRTDGTKAGTYVLKRNVFKIMKAGSNLFFISNDANAYQLWKTEGTVATSLMIKTLNGFPREFTDVVGALYFHTGSGRLWKSDGTPRGTAQIAQLSVISKIYSSEGRVYVVSDQSTGGLYLWKYEEGALYFVKQIRSPGNGNTAIPAEYPNATLNGIFYFVANDGGSGNELWRSDGTNAGTYRFIDLNYNDFTTGDVEGGIDALLVFKNRLYISAIRPTYAGLFYTEGSDFLTFVHDGHVTQMAANNTEIFIWFEEWDGDFYFRGFDGDYANGYLISFLSGGRQHVDYAIINETLFYAGEKSSNLERYEVGGQTASVPTGIDGAYPLEPLENSLVFIGATAVTGDEPYIYRNIGSSSPSSIVTTISPQSHMGTKTHTTVSFTSYPNPFTAEFTMRINGPEDEVFGVDIYSKDGLIIDKFTRVKPNTDYRDIGRDWLPGMYIVKVSDRSGVRTQMIIKK